MGVLVKYDIKIICTCMLFTPYMNIFSNFTYDPIVMKDRVKNTKNITKRNKHSKIQVISSQQIVFLSSVYPV